MKLNMKINKANLKVSKKEPTRAQVKEAERDIEKYVKLTHADVVALRSFARRKQWTEIRLAIVCQAAIEAFQNSFPGQEIPSLRKLLSELKPRQIEEEEELN